MLFLQSSWDLLCFSEVGLLGLLVRLLSCPAFQVIVLFLPVPLMLLRGGAFRLVGVRVSLTFGSGHDMTSLATCTSTTVPRAWDLWQIMQYKTHYSLQCHAALTQVGRPNDAAGPVSLLEHKTSLWILGACCLLCLHSCSCRNVAGSSFLRVKHALVRFCCPAGPSFRSALRTVNMEHFKRSCCNAVVSFSEQVHLGTSIGSF